MNINNSKPVKFLFIRFCSRRHVFYFVISTLIVPMSFLANLLLGSFWVSKLAMLIFFGMSVLAYQDTKKIVGESENGFSKDCVWWNATLALICLGITAYFYVR